MKELMSVLVGHGFVGHVLMHVETLEYILLVLPESTEWYEVVSEDYTDVVRTYPDGDYQLADGVVL
jgi:hypothetical protein